MRIRCSEGSNTKPSFMRSLRQAKLTRQILCSGDGAVMLTRIRLQACGPVHASNGPTRAEGAGEARGEEKIWDKLVKLSQLSCAPSCSLFFRLRVRGQPARCAAVQLAIDRRSPAADVVGQGWSALGPSPSLTPSLPSLPGSIPAQPQHGPSASTRQETIARETRREP